MPAGVGELHRSGDQRDVSTRLARCGGDGEAHFPGAAVGQVAHRIQPFARRPRGDQYVDPGQQARVGRRLQEGAREHVGLPHAADADLAAGLIAGRGPQNADAARFQDADIGLGRLVGPHHAVHRRSEHDRRLGGDTERGQQIVRAAAREPRNEIGGGRRDQHELRPAGELDVAHGGFRGLVPQSDAGRSAGNGLKGHRGSRTSAQPRS